MASRSPAPPPPKHPAPSSHTTILSLGDDLLLEVFLRLPSLPSLVRATLACRAFAAAVRFSPRFRRLFVALRPPPLLGLFFDYDDMEEMPSFSPVRRSSDPDLAAAARGVDVSHSRFPGHDRDVPWWQIVECRGGFLLLLSFVDQIAVYNPLSRALHLLPTPPDEINNGRCHIFYYTDSYLLSSDEAPGSFRVITIFYGKSRLRAAIFSSGTGEWQILPRSKPAAGQPSGKKYWFRHERHVILKLYWSHPKLTYKVVLDTITLQFSFIDPPKDLKGEDDLYMTGETKDGKPCIVSAEDFTLSIWLQGTDADGVEKWVLDSVIPLEEEVLRATKGSLDDHVDLKVLAILDGIVYLSTFETIIDASVPCWYLLYCLETRRLEKIFHEKNSGHVHPYIMAWPTYLVGNDRSP